MSIELALNGSKRQKVKIPRRFATLDFARGTAIFLMIALHTLSLALNIEVLLADIDNVTVINLVLLAIIPFYGGLAGFFLLVSSTSNMVSMYRDLEKGNSVRSLVVKQVLGGILLLIFAMICESVTGYRGVVGNFFKFLDRPAEYFQYNPESLYEHWGAGTYNWQSILWRFNHFETIHTIAWCLILNGLVQGLLSLKKNWQNRKRMMISYAVLAVVVVGLTLPIWELVKVIMPNYPFGMIPETGNALTTPVLGQDKWWRFLAAPFLTALAAPMEPIFPYLAVSFIGSIIGIAISKPREEVNQKFPRNMFLVGLTMFITGLVGVVVIIIGVLGATDFDTAIDLYKYIPHHRHWSSDYQGYIPQFAWLAQFLCLNGFSIMLLMFLLRLVEFRGKGQQLSAKTKSVRRFGTVAFSNYNNQFLYYIVFYIISGILTFSLTYKKLFWFGTVVTIGVSLILFHFLLRAWEKIKYVGSLEWFIRTISNNIIPLRRKKFDASVKWWQKGLIDVRESKIDWIDLSPIPSTAIDEAKTDAVSIDEQKQKTGKIKPMHTMTQLEQRDSKLALILSIVGLVTLLFNAVSIFGLFVSIKARKTEGKNKRNNAAFIISIIGCVLFAAFYIFCFSVKVGTLGIPL